MTRLLVSLMCVFLLCFVSCSKKEPVSEVPKTEIEKDTVSPEPDKDILGETEPLPEETEKPRLPDVSSDMTEISALTGLPCTPEQKACRPVALSMNNLLDALPQCGISFADIVWECNMEGGITRLLAIFSDISKASELGAVRSARDYFVEIASMYDAVLVHAGGSPDFYSEDKARGYDNIDEVNMAGIPSGTFWRDSEKRYSRGYEHSLETSGDKIAHAMSALGYRCDGGAKSFLNFYSEFTKPEGDEGNKITLPHSSYITTRFTYSEEGQRYFKESYSSPHVDETTGETLSFENVLVLFADHRVVDSELRLDIKLVGQGSGVLLTAGVARDVIWTRSSSYHELVLSDADGAPVMLNPGKTHITVFDNAAKSSVTIE